MVFPPYICKTKTKELEAQEFRKRRRITGTYDGLKKLQESFGGSEKFSTFAVPNREMGKRRRQVRARQNDFRVTKKNFKKVLAVRKKLITFALANQGQDDRFKIPDDAKRTKFIDITYNNQVKKKNQSVNFIEFEYKDKQTYNGEFDPGSG